MRQFNLQALSHCWKMGAVVLAHIMWAGKQFRGVRTGDQVKNFGIEMQF